MMLFADHNPMTIPVISDCAGKTNAWYRGDQETRYDGTISERKITLPYNKTDITYAWNSMGYRCPEFDVPKTTRPRVCFYGNSCVEGYGLPEQDTLPMQFSKHWDNWLGGEKPEIYNLAKAGASNDFISRVIYSTVPILKPDLVVIYWTYVTRREVHAEDGTALSFMKSWSTMSVPYPEQYHRLLMSQHALSNWRADANNFLRNYLFMRYFLQAHSIPYVWSLESDNWYQNKHQWFEQWDHDRYVNCGLENYYFDYSRDQMHPGPKSIDVISKRLFDHYCKMFR